MTGREREALERKARSLRIKLDGFVGELIDAEIDDPLGVDLHTVSIRLNDASSALCALIEGPLFPGVLRHQSNEETRRGR